MGDRSANGLPTPLQAWLDAERASASDTERISLLEDLIAYWVPVSTERDLRLEAIEARIGDLEAARVPDRYPCIVDLAARVTNLEATVWELRRRLGL